MKHRVTDPNLFDIQLSPRRIVSTVAVCAAIVLVIGYIREIIVAIYPESAPSITSVSLDSETNLPSWFSSLLIAFVGLLMLWTSGAERRQGIRTATGWTVLGLGFFLLSLDETTSLHERFGGINLNIPDPWGLLTFRWVAFGAIGLIVGFTLFLPFLLRLPRTTARRLLTAGAVFVAGAVGMEMIDGALRSAYGTGPIYAIGYCLEETFELLGMTLGLRAVLLHLAELRRPSSRPQPI